MRPLSLVLAAVVTVAAAYAVIFWRNASDVRQQMEAEQAATESEVRQYDDVYNELPSDRRPQPGFNSNPVLSGRPAEEPGTPPANRIGGASDSTATESTSLDTDLMPAPQEAMSASAGVELKKEQNYSALEQTVRRIGTDIQRQMRRGEILRRGPRVGAAFLEFMGYAVESNGQHITMDGSFMVDVRGPDLVVVTGTSQEFGNQLELSVFGPRDVDSRLQRVR